MKLTTIHETFEKLYNPRRIASLVVGPEVLYLLLWWRGAICALLSFAISHWIPAVMLFSVPQSVCHKVGHLEQILFPNNTKLVELDCYCFFLALTTLSFLKKTSTQPWIGKPLRLSKPSMCHVALDPAEKYFRLSNFFHFRSSVPLGFWDWSPSKFA